MIKFYLIICLISLLNIGYSQNKEALLDTLSRISTLDGKLKEMILVNLEANGFNLKDSSSELAYLVNKNFDSSQAILLKEIRNFYDKSFTIEELKAYVEFYNSSVGKNILIKLPLLLLELDKLATKFAKNILSKDHEIAQNVKANSINEQDCKSLHTGEFQYTYPDGTVSKIIRDENFQYQYYPTKVNKYSIIWIDPCMYELKYIGSEALTHYWNISKFRIKELGSNFYKYVSTTEGIEEIVEDSVTIIKLNGK